MNLEELEKEIARAKIAYSRSGYEDIVKADQEKRIGINRRDYMTLALVGIMEISKRVSFSGRVWNIFVDYAQIVERYLFDMDPEKLLKAADELIEMGLVQPELPEEQPEEPGAEDGRDG